MKREQLSQDLIGRRCRILGTNHIGEIVGINLIGENTVRVEFKNEIYMYGNYRGEYDADYELIRLLKKKQPPQKYWVPLAKLYIDKPENIPGAEQGNYVQVTLVKGEK